MKLKAWEGIYKAQRDDWSHKEVIKRSWITCWDWRLGSKMGRIIWVRGLLPHGSQHGVPLAGVRSMHRDGKTISTLFNWEAGSPVPSTMSSSWCAQVQLKIWLCNQPLLGLPEASLEASMLSGTEWYPQPVGGGPAQEPGAQGVGSQRKTWTSGWLQSYQGTTALPSTLGAQVLRPALSEGHQGQHLPQTVSSP